MSATSVLAQPARDSAYIGMPILEAYDAHILFALSTYDKLAIKELNATATAEFGRRTHLAGRGPAIAAAAWICIVILVTIALLRIHVRRRKMRESMRPDDWTVLIATLFAVIYFCLNLHAVHFGGLGRRLEDQTYREYAVSHQLPTLPLFLLASSLIKLSIALFVRKLPEMQGRTYKIIGNGSVVAIGLYNIMAFFITLFPAHPVHAFYNLEYAGRNRIELAYLPKGVLTAVNAFDIVLNIGLFAVPTYLLYRSHLVGSAKIRVIFLLLLALLAWTTSVVRVAQNPNYPTYHDQYHWQYTGLMWSFLELLLGFLVVSLPTLNSLLENQEPILRTWKSTFTGKIFTGQTSPNWNMRGQHASSGERFDKKRTSSLNAIQTWRLRSAERSQAQTGHQYRTRDSSFLRRTLSVKPTARSIKAHISYFTASSVRFAKELPARCREYRRSGRSAADEERSEVSFSSDVKHLGRSSSDFGSIIRKPDEARLVERSDVNMDELIRRESWFALNGYGREMFRI